MGKSKDLQIDDMNNGIIVDDDPTDEEEGIAFSQPNHYPSKAELDSISQSQDIESRKLFAERAYALVQAWVGFLIVITIAQFTLGKSDDFGLSQLEFNLVFTTTTASVFGFWFLVGKYLFNTKKP